MKTALVLCGGSSHGAIEVGLYQALEELRIDFDFIVGTSIGAINGALIAAGIPAEQVAASWRILRTRDVISKRFWWWKLLRNAPSISSPRRLKRFLCRHLPVRHFEALKKKLVVVATDLERNEPVLLEQGDLVEALLASSALPGVFPPRRLNGRLLVDGAITANMPVLIARDLGARRIITFPCRCLVDWKQTPDRILNVLLKSLSILMYTQEVCHLEAVKRDVETIVVDACPGKRLNALDFDHAHELIEPAYQQARQLLSRMFGVQETVE